MKVIDLIRNSKSTAFSFEILPPLKGNSIQKVYNVIDKLKEFDPKYINITSHHSEFVYKTLPDGSFQKVNIRKRPGSVAIASAIQNKYGIPAVPHIIRLYERRDGIRFDRFELPWRKQPLNIKGRYKDLRGLPAKTGVISRPRN